jgi:hypothetical protein
MAVSTTPETSYFTSSHDATRKTIIDRQRKLIISLNEDRHEKMSQVEKFVGLYPSWPITEVAVTPTGTAKDNRIHQFVKCIGLR